MLDIGNKYFDHVIFFIILIGEDELLMELQHEQQQGQNGPDPMLMLPSLGLLDDTTTTDPSTLMRVLEHDVALGRRLEEILKNETVPL